MSAPVVDSAEIPSQSNLRLTRRQFLWGTASFGVAAALPIAWSYERPLRFGFLGLGSRGRAALDTCRQVQGLEIAALCDRLEPRLASAAMELGNGARLLAQQSDPVFADPKLDACVLAVAAADQTVLAEAACRAGKHVLLVRPITPDVAALRRLAAVAAEHDREVHVARETGFSMPARLAAGLVGSFPPAVNVVEVHARFTSPSAPPPESLFSELVDEIDFARASLSGRVTRALRWGGRSALPGHWLDERREIALASEGHRQRLAVAVLSLRGEPARKQSRILLSGPSGAAHLLAGPLARFDPNDVHLFLDGIRRRASSAALTLPRVVELLDP